ncbi:MAG: helix-turn-helix domain-containing protein [Chloroflexi bacterium]|nr:helix-turn-helix domain-containing protein [Chloroflexota bacterium]
MPEQNATGLVPLDVVRQVVREVVREEMARRTSAEPLTKAERNREIDRLLKNGLTQKEVAQWLSVAPATITVYLKVKAARENSRSGLENLTDRAIREARRLEKAFGANTARMLMEEANTREMSAPAILTVVNEVQEKAKGMSPRAARALVGAILVRDGARRGGGAGTSGQI